MPVVTAQEQLKWDEKLVNLCDDIVADKRVVYVGGSTDVHRNFRVSASVKGPMVTVGSEIATHLIKQVSAVVDILCNPNSQDKERDTRFADLINYTRLAYSAYKEGALHETSESRRVVAHSSEPNVHDNDDLFDADSLRRLRLDEAKRFAQGNLRTQSNVQSSTDEQREITTPTLISLTDQKHPMGECGCRDCSGSYRY